MITEGDESHMHDLQDRVNRHDYEVDCALVAEAMLARPWAFSLMGLGLLSPARGRSRAGDAVRPRPAG